MRWLAVLSVVAATGCGGNPASVTIEETTFDAGLNVDLGASTKLANGEYVRDVVVGTGAEVTAGQTISVAYEGFLPSGELFDSNLGDGGVLTFVYGQKQVLAGWDQGLGGVKRGGTRQLILPPALAYGVTAGAPPAVPPNTVVVFSLSVNPVTTGAPPGCHCGSGGALMSVLGVLVFVRRKFGTWRSAHA